MKYAIFKSGGKQYKVAEGDVLTVERLPQSKDQEFITSSVLLYISDRESRVGSPFVNGVEIRGKILGHEKGEKIRVAKFKSKVRYRRIRGHRQSLTKIQIEKIIESGLKEAPKRKVSTTPKTSVKQ